jgi:hypothetical protein
MRTSHQKVCREQRYMQCHTADSIAQAYPGLEDASPDSVHSKPYQDLTHERALEKKSADKITFCIYSNQSRLKFDHYVSPECSC